MTHSQPKKKVVRLIRHFVITEHDALPVEAYDESFSSTGIKEKDEDDTIRGMGVPGVSLEDSDPSGRGVESGRCGGGAGTAEEVSEMPMPIWIDQESESESFSRRCNEKDE